MHIIFQGQLGMAATVPQIEHEVPPGTTLAQLLSEIACDLPEEARNLVLQADGSPNRSLFMAIDEVHMRDTDAVIPEGARELLLMPPMAGG